jgi:hypothetical protein
MRQFLICCGANGDSRSLDWLRLTVETRNPDGVLFAGGVLANNRRYVPRASTSWGMSREDAIYVERFFRTLGQLRRFAAIIPGDSDVPLEEFLRLGMHAEIEFPCVHLVHANLTIEDGLAVCGIGGEMCEGPACELDVCSRVMAEYYLRPLSLVPQPHKLLLLAHAPIGPLGGRTGSSLVSDLINSYHPSVCIVGGAPENRGVARIAHTLIVNPGKLSDGWAAWLDFNLPVENRVQLLNILEDLECPHDVRPHIQHGAHETVGPTPHGPPSMAVCHEPSEQTRKRDQGA